MNRLKQGMAAFALVTSLGLVVPSTFGGSASADPVPYPGGKTEPPRWFYCDRDGDGTNESSYYVVSTENNNGSFHDLLSSTILAYSYDVRDRHYVSFDPNDPSAPPVEDFTVENIFYGQNGQGNKNGKFAQAVPCHEYSQFDTVGDGDPVEEHEGVNYHVDQDRTWYVTVTGSGKGALKAASADSGKHHKKNHHKGKNGKHGH